MQGCICPHPPLLIPEVGGTARNKIAATVNAMEKLAASVGQPETIVVISPHADDFGASHAVKTAERLRGDFGRFRCPEAAFSYDNDVQFAELLLALSGDSRKLRIVPDDGDVLDWGVLVPLSFLRPDRIVSLSRGRAVRRAHDAGTARAALRRGTRQGHAVPRLRRPLARAHPRGAGALRSARQAASTTRCVSLLGVGDFPGLMRIEPVLLDGAAECGLRSLVALGGFLGDDAMVEPEIFKLRGSLRRRLPRRALRSAAGAGGRPA